MADIMEPVTRPQGPFYHRTSPSADWQQAGLPVPGAYLPGDQYQQDSFSPPGGQYQQESLSPPGGQYQQNSFSPPGGQYQQDSFLPPGGQYQQDGFSPPGGQYQQDSFLPPGGQYQQDGFSPPGGQYPQDSFLPPGGQYPQDSPYSGGIRDEPGGQYPLAGAFQQPESPQPWPEAQAGAMPVVEAPALPAGPDQYSQGDAYPDPYGNGQGQFGPGIQYGSGRGPDGQGVLGKLPFKSPPVPVAVAVAVVVGIVIIVVGVRALSSMGGSSSSAVGNGTGAAATPIASSATGTTASSGTSAATGTSVLTQQQAATALSGLLVQSDTVHTDVNAAIAKVKGCTDLTADEQAFNKAAANRRTMLALLAKLRQVPGRSALSPAMLTDLTDGWQASATVDADLANWATSEVGHCTKNDLGNPAYRASLPYDSKATKGKTAFVQQWNGLARKYGLAVYQPSQI